MKKFSILFLTILVGCATTAGYEQMLTTWVGSSESNLISSWGPPENIYALDDGGKVLTYINKRNVQIGGYTTTKPVTTYSNGNISGDINANYNSTSTTYMQTTTPVQNINMSCSTRFTFRNGVVQAWAWQGNDCKAIARDAPVQKASGYVQTQEYDNNNLEICKRNNQGEDEIQKCLSRLNAPHVAPHIPQ